MSVELEIRLFATLKDRAGSDRIRVELPDRAATAADVIRAVAAGYPALAPALPSALLAVNRAFAAPDTPVKAGDEVALFPPVSGGQGDAPAGEASAPTVRCVASCFGTVSRWIYIHLQLTQHYTLRTAKL